MNSMSSTPITVQMLQTIVFAFQVQDGLYESNRKIEKSEAHTKTMVKPSIRIARETCFGNSHLDCGEMVVVNGGVIRPGVWWTKSLSYGGREDASGEGDVERKFGKGIAVIENMDFEKMEIPRL
jgi:hypothetical protein